jgi:hypothetical protein
MLTRGSGLSWNPGRWKTALVGSARRIAIPVGIGLVSFLVIAGPKILEFRNIRWLAERDPATYFLAWHFFRNTPWSLPLGDNPRYGGELAGGIAHADNVPLLAIAFKVIEGWLPEVFQYFGLWLCASFVLQACFAWLLVGLSTRNALARAFGSWLFVLAPPFLWRLREHYSMLGQWLVLAGLYLCLGPRPRSRGAAWPLLAFTASVVHTYTTVMVLGLWLTDWIRRVWLEGRTRADFVQLALVPGLVLLGFWQSGLFLVTDGLAQHGFGKYHLNLLGLIDPSGWSYLVPDLPGLRGDREGFNYLGLGGLLLALLALPALRRAWPAVRERRHYWPLFVLMVGFTCFAISTTIGIGTWTFALPVPESLIQRANLLRASGRMFWPVFYLLLWVLVRHVVLRYPARFAGYLLAGAALIQAADTSAGWLPIRRNLERSGDSWPSPLKAEFWRQVPGRYREIRVLPPVNHGLNYAPFAYLAAMHGLTTDSVYLARVDHQKLERAKRRAARLMKTGRYSASTIYVLDESYEKAARARLRPGVDRLEWIDGFLVLAPAWWRR